MSFLDRFVLSGRLRWGANLPTLLFIVGLLGFIGCASASQARDMFQRSWPVMGTYAELQIDHDSSSLVRTSESRVRDVFNRVNRVMSTYSPQSDLMAVNRTGTKRWVTVDPWLVDILKKGKRFARVTGGAFSLDVLGYGVKRGVKPGDPTYQLPPAGDTFIQVDPSSSRVRLHRQGMGLDLGAIAKGYALDRAVQALEKLGVNRFFLSLGRGIYAGTSPRGHSGWPVRIQGDTKIRKLQQVFLSVSEQGIQSDTGHIIDPRDGQPIEGAGRVAVFASRGWLADAASTAIFVEPSIRTKLLRRFSSLRRVSVFRP